jgi:hypothetical protein
VFEDEFNNTAASSMSAMMRMAPPQRVHLSGSTPIAFDGGISSYPWLEPLEEDSEGLVTGH